MVYVISNNGNPLMPTSRYAKVRILLKNKQAKVVKRNPFTIRLLYDTTEYTQPITLGIDSGYTYIGFSAISQDKELISGDATLLGGMSQRIKEKHMYRTQRRARLRYRAPRFDNRKRKEGWFAPSIQHKLDSHIRLINKLQGILPITNMIVEVANFDTQKLKNPAIEGVEYQQGEKKDFYNLREYLIHRDEHTCQFCGATGITLQMHHIGYWKNDNSDRPGNLTALCTNCHLPKNHDKGHILYGWQPKLKSFREATFMSTVRWRLVQGLSCNHTYGWMTKSRRIDQILAKTHANDAFCIAGGTPFTQRITPLSVVQVRRNNRSLERFYDAKYVDVRTGSKVLGQQLFSGRRTRNKNHNQENLHKYRGEKVSKGRRSIRKQRYFYQPNDLVKYKDNIVAVKGTHNKGTRVMLKTIPKEVSVKVSELIPYQFCKGLVIA